MEAVNPKVAEMLDFAEGFAAGIANSPGRGSKLVIWGPNGTGKTMLARAIHVWVGGVARLLQYRDAEGNYHSPSSMMVHWPSALDEMKSGRWNIVQSMGEPELLVLDEIGGEHDPSKIGVDKLCSILSARDHKWTIVTTNKSPDEWPHAFDRRVESRLLRNSIVIDTAGVPDFNTL